MNVSGNRLTDKCVPSLSRFLQRTSNDSCRLFEVNLAKNDFSSSLIFQTEDILLKSKTLTKLNLKDNSINVKGTKKLIEILEANKIVQAIDLRNNPGFNKKASLLLLDKLKRNLNIHKAKRQFKSRGSFVIKKEESINTIEIKKDDYLKKLSAEKLNKANNSTELFNKKLIRENSELIENFGSIKKSLNSLANENPKCENCSILRHRMLKMEFENQKLRIQLRNLTHRNSKLFQSRKVKRIFNQPKQRIRRKQVGSIRSCELISSQTKKPKRESIIR